MGLGIVIRDAKGEMTTTSCQKIEVVSSLILGELITLVYVLQHCSDIGLNKVTLEGNTKKIIELVNCAEKKIGLTMDRW